MAKIKKNQPEENPLKVIKNKLKKSKTSIDNKQKAFKAKIKTSGNDETKLLKIDQAKHSVENKNEPKFTEEEQKERNTRTIFIGNLPANTKKQQLAKLLNPYGEMVSCRFRRPDGKKLLNKVKPENFSYIIAYAVMKSVEEVEKCLVLNGSNFKNHHIRVTKLEKNFSENESAIKRTIFVGNLKYSATDEKLHNVFSTCGNIEYVRTINSENGCKGYAYVCFEKRDSVGLAMELDKTLLDDRPIHVEKYSENKKQSQKKNSTKILTGFERRMMKKMSKELGYKMEPSRKFSKSKSEKNNLRGFKKQPKKEAEKSNFKGKKANIKKQNKKFKKHNHLKELAKKIAPKDK